MNSLLKLILVVILISPFQTLFAEKLFLIKYGESLYPSILTNRLKGKTVELGWYFFYLEKDTYRILIDSGTTDIDKVKRFKLKGYKSPESLLLKIGVSSDSITDIFITHSHFDHIEGTIKFPNAKIHIQSVEYDLFKKNMFYIKNKLYFEKKENDGFVKQYNGLVNIYNIIRLIPTNGHTIGSQAIEVKTEKSHYLFTGDECYFIAECKKGIGTFSSALYSVKNNSSFMKKIKDLQLSSDIKILTMHDPELEKELEVIE